MSGNLSNFDIDWNTVEVTDFQVLPAGIYAAKITGSEIKDTKKGNGKYVKLELTLMGSKGIQGRKIFEICILEHTNDVAANIGRGKIKTLANLLGLNFDELSDTSELHGKPFGVKLTIETSKDYGEQNRVKGFSEFTEDLLLVSTTGESVSGF